MSCACNLKNYGCRTLVDNWYEQRIALEKHFGDTGVQTKDMTVECHIKPSEENPKWEMDYPPVTRSQYQDDTDISHLEERNNIHRRIHTADRRRRLQGTATMAQEIVPGSTLTPRYLTHQFEDPNKTRFKTTYQKAYCRPETSFYRTRGTNSQQSPRAKVKPRYACTDSTWSPGWRKK